MYDRFEDSYHFEYILNLILSIYLIVNNTLHELYLIQNITTRSKYNECTYYLFQILQVQLNLLYFISKYNAEDKNISSALWRCEK